MFLLTHALQINSTLLYLYELAKFFPVNQITHVAIAKTYTSMKARDVKNENQMKSSFFRGNLSPRKGKVSYFLPLLDKHKFKVFICCVKVTKFVCKEITLL